MGRGGWMAHWYLECLPAVCMAGLCCLTLAGCSSGLGAGPLGGHYDSGDALCSPVSRGQVLSDGFDDIENPGDAPATIEAVSLADPHDLRLVAAYIIPISGDDLYGVFPGYPSAPVHEPGVLWSQRHLAAGAIVPHSHGPHGVSNLLMVLQPTASTGTAAGTLVSYRDAGKDYQFEIPIKIIVPVGPRCH